MTVILLIFVIPQFESLFKGFGADLPAFTQMVINLSQIRAARGHLSGGGRRRRRLGLHLLQEALAQDARVPRPRYRCKFPIIGPILNKAAIARYARTLSTMFAAGVPLVEALESVAGATGNIVYENAVMKMRDEVATGQRLQRAMENTGLFPNMVVQMIAVGEESGSLDTMSAKVATFYEAEVDNAVDSMSSLLEPLIMVVLGVLVGGLVIAMYLPIFKLGVGRLTRPSDARRRARAAFSCRRQLVRDRAARGSPAVHRRLPGAGPGRRQLPQRRHLPPADHAGAAVARAVRGARSSRTAPRPRRRPGDRSAFNLVVPRSACPACKAPITALQNIPVAQLAACCAAAAPAAARASACAIRSSKLLTRRADGGWWRGSSASAGRRCAALVLTWFLIALTFIDLDHQLLPDA